MIVNVFVEDIWVLFQVKTFLKTRIKRCEQEKTAIKT